MNLSRILPASVLAGCLGASPAAAFGHGLALEPLGTYASGICDQGAAEIVAHDPARQRLFVVNAKEATVDVISIKDPRHPTKEASLDVSPYGAVANSVAVHNGIVAVAVENDNKQAPGKVVFFNRGLVFKAWVEVGALPDMLTFTPDGRRVLVANEGEPSSDYTRDPEGSISIINLSRGLGSLRQSDVRTADFKAFNNAPLDDSIRIFGPNASVAQDLEPEYIAIAADSRTAYVTCQENNALAIVDIARAEVKQLVGLGFKDHSVVTADTAIYTLDPAGLPSIGSTDAGQPLFLGGFSGLHFEGVDETTGNLKFLTHTDRGPNAEPTGLRRPFLLPAFTPELVRLQLDRATGTITIIERLPLKDSAGEPLTGLPNTAVSSSASAPHNDEIPVDLRDQVLPLDVLGGDFEGVVTDPVDGSVWMVDEYRPAIYHFDATGILITRYVPLGTAAAAGEPAGTFGTEVLPAVLAQRRQNRGFEAVAFDNGKVYAFVQSPLRNPTTLGNSTLNVLQNVRVIEFDPATETTRSFIYVMDNPVGPAQGSRPDKIGDAVSLGNGEFLVVERDDDSVFNVDDPAQIEKKIYRFNLTGATDITDREGVIGGTGKTVDQLTAAELKAEGIQPIVKQLEVDLNLAGYNTVEKVEGLTVIDPWTYAVINDNDFGVANIVVNTNDGTFVLGDGYTPETVQLGLIRVSGQGLDASDRDAKINIRPWPVKGVYMPDTIASHKVGRWTFLVTANEGDAREYTIEDPVTGDDIPVFVEALRAGSSSVALDPARFPDAAVLKNNANLGRLNITSTLGRNPVTGLYEELYAFGTRSFSIWTSTGVQVFDSGDDFERIIAAVNPQAFNASNTNNDRDNRSDDKGPEPEGVVVGQVGLRTYAFIGLERVGGVMIYDITNPFHPKFVNYVNNRDFTQDVSLEVNGEEVSNPAAGDLGPEGLLFIDAQDSPTRRPLLVVGNEISGTTTVYQITCED